MKDVLSENALQALYEEGFVRTGIHLPELLVNRICSLYDSMPASRSNWHYFHTSCLSNYSDIKNWNDFKTRFVRKYMPWRVQRYVCETIYDKAILGSSEVLLPVLEECIHQGLASHFGEIPQLVGHDIYLENSRHKTTFGFHHDSFGWEIFYQTGDDVTAYIALQDLNAQSGGRLYVERHANTSAPHKDRNQYIRRFAEYCCEHAGTNHRGQVTRELIISSRKRKLMAREYERVLEERYALPQPGMEKMRLIDAVKGEVVLFNNKNFHAVEPWKRDERRKNYIIRLFPLYDMRMAPPATFLNKAPCNRFVIKGKQGKLESFDPEQDSIRFSEVPH